jgi:hypothetical protein
MRSPARCGTGASASGADSFPQLRHWIIDWLMEGWALVGVTVGSGLPTPGAGAGSPRRSPPVGGRFDVRLAACGDPPRRGRSTEAPHALVSFKALFCLRGKMALTKKQLSHLEKRLLDERERALKALGLFDG